MLNRILDYVISHYVNKMNLDPIASSILYTKLIKKYRELYYGTFEMLITLPKTLRMRPILRNEDKNNTVSEVYWNRHSVRGKIFLSRQSSLAYIRELTDGRPLKKELLRLHNGFENQVILDYGCGPGNDLAGFAEFSMAKRIIGVDISEKALQLARQRVSFHIKDVDQVSFIKVSDDEPSIPLDDESVDYVQSLGVIHHASSPENIFREFFRVMKPDGEARVMVYNADSIYIQLEIGYFWKKQADKNGRAFEFSGLRPEEVFSKIADLGAPIARCLRPADFQAWVGDTPFEVDYLGGYFMPNEIDDWQEKVKEVLRDPDLSYAQREYFESLVVGKDQMPFYKGKPAGLGSVYVLKKRNRLELNN